MSSKTCEAYVRVLAGALRLWGVSATVEPDPHDASAFVVAPASGSQLELRHRPAEGWALTRGEMPLGCFAGLPGLLRALRDELAPDAPAGRLIIGR